MDEGAKTSGRQGDMGDAADVVGAAATGMPPPEVREKHLCQADEEILRSAAASMPSWAFQLVFVAMWYYSDRRFSWDQLLLLVLDAQLSVSRRSACAGQRAYRQA